MQAMSGLMSMTGPPGSGPWRVGIPLSDTAAGTFLTQGILAAAKATRGRIVVVEDHYEWGGLGDAVLEAVGNQAQVRAAGSPDAKIVTR